MRQPSSKAEATVVSASSDNAPPSDSPERYQGFSLRSVTWGYRDIFAKAIEALFQQGSLGPQRQEVTAKFFALLKRSDQSCFDHVLHQFLGALNPRNRWIMDLPGVFADLVELGCALAASKLYYGIRFFDTLAGSGMGGSSQEVQGCLNWLRRLRETDEDLAMAFLAGYARLSQRLLPVELERYMEVALQIHHGNRGAAYRFLRGELNTSETYILAITRECRICDVAEPLRAMIRALTGHDCELSDLSGLDSDELMGRGSQTVTVNGHMYLPVRIRRFDTARTNRHWYVLCGVVSAAMFLEDSFPRIHGHPHYRTCADLTGDEVWRLNLFQTIEFLRVLRSACRRWPGVRRLVAFGVRTEIANFAAGANPERLLADALNESVKTDDVVAHLRRLADDCVNCFDTAQRLDAPWTKDVRAAYPSLDLRPLRPMGFLSDFLFPVSFSAPPTDRLITDLKDAARKRRSKAEQEGAPAVAADRGNNGKELLKEEAGKKADGAVFVYDEWDFQQNDYHADWCHVHQKTVEPAAFAQPQADWRDEARKVRIVFERIKPDIARRAKHLADGDTINQDLLVTHVVERFVEPCPRIRFYEKPIINHRDLAVLILLDVSGSTGEQLGAQAKMLDIEKQAGVILGQGLSVLGDRFALCGFSSNGREQCEYLVFKDFEDAWSGDAIGRVMAAWPRGSTRIGPALRHSGFLLARQPSRQRLIILVTDGKPMDEGYDPATRYAQHDVRMACEEIARQDIHTFAISTAENSVADMELMFPRRRFAVLPDIRNLSAILPRLYIRMTTR